MNSGCPHSNTPAIKPPIPALVTQVQPGVLTPTEHIHQVGNDRITALASNYGHVRVRQDEGLS